MIEAFNIPHVRAGQAVGLLGGSFDPAHEGHVQLTKAALKAFQLDQIWWLMSPANPLKRHAPQSLALRMEYAKGMMQHPKVKITCLERDLGTTYTADTLRALKAKRPYVSFMWLMGADNLAGFHTWREWQQICHMMPIGVLARPEHTLKARCSKMARTFRHAQHRPHTFHTLAHQNAPAWGFVNMPMNDQSSTKLRQSGAWSL